MRPTHVQPDIPLSQPESEQTFEKSVSPTDSVPVPERNSVDDTVRTRSGRISQPAPRLNL